MQGDQLARQFRIIREIEASPNGLTVAEIAEREERGIPTICRYLEVPQAVVFPLYTKKVERANRWAFIDTFKFKIPPPLALTDFISLCLCRDKVGVFKGTNSLDSLETPFKKVRSSLSTTKAIAYLDRS